ncbi:hypothetical protein L2D45_29130 [Vibrio harveyi]
MCGGIGIALLTP